MSRTRALVTAARLVLPVALLSLVLPWPNHAEAAGPPPSRYTMTAFTNSSEKNMFVYESLDGTGFRLLKGSAYVPPTGLVRDPSMFRNNNDGSYYLAYTTGWDGNTIGLARSFDRTHWHFLRNYTIPLRGVRHTWAPVWFVDGDRVDLIVSLSFGGDFRPFLMTATDPTLTTWTRPVPLNGIATNHIDLVMVKTGPIYHAFVKNETTKFVEHAIAPAPTGPFTFLGTGNWAHWGAPREGPSLTRLDNGCWRIYLDGYTIGRYFYSDSCNGFVSWTPPRRLPGLSGFVRHFTILKETVG